MVMASRSNRRFLGVALLVGTLMLSGVVPVGAAEDEFTVDGGGWGHGVGMSQYGAYGMAQDGASVAEIISHFYSGATLQQASGLGTVPGWVFQPQALAVNVASNRSQLDFVVQQANPAGVAVCHRGDGTGADDCSGPPDLVVTGSQTLRVSREGNVCTRSVLVGGSVVADSEVDGACSFDITWNDSYSDLSPSTLIKVEELRYARGPFEIRPSLIGVSFDVTVRLGMEEYLYGLGEVPLGWPVETLKAQVVAARSYAVNVVANWGGSDGSGRRPDCGCHIRRTVADQNYDAWEVEAADTSGRWRGAVGATEGLVVTHPQVSGGSAIVTTYYSSSTGGATEDVEDVFGGSAQPHLKSVPDPWGANPAINPLARWTVTVPETVLRTRLCHAGSCWERVTGGEMISGPPGARIRLLGLNGRQVVSTEVSATWLYNILNGQGSRVSPYILGVKGPSPFVDIDTSVHRADIVYIANIDVTRGCNPPDNNLFCPIRPVTRAEMASFLVRALGLARGGDDAFVDDAGSVHEVDINALAAAGITRGCNPPAGDQFCPDRAVTRGEMAAFLVRAYAYTDPGEGDLFVDDNDSIFSADIDRLAVAGVTRGCNPPDNDRFCPHEAVTREQMASFLTRALTG